MKYDWFDIADEDRNKWESICPPGEYRVVTWSAIKIVLSGVLPDALIHKYNSVFIAGSATLNGNLYFMAYGNRVDASGSAINQMPFNLAFIGNTVSGSDRLIQHGNWVNRTTTPPVEFWRHINASGTAINFPLSELPTESSGAITDLNIDSQNEAFGRLVEVLIGQVE